MIPDALCAGFARIEMSTVLVIFGLIVGEMVK
jgi:hypothetical protein